MEDFEILDLMEDLSIVGHAKTPLDVRLEIYKEIELAHPGCHIGGSIGLFLHGIDLGRNFIDSDIDICSFQPHGSRLTRSNKGYSETELTSSTDMDEMCYKSEVGENGLERKIKIEYKYDRTQDYKIVEYKGVTYRVTSPEIILGWKVLFACRGAKKHREDLDKLEINYIKRGACHILCPFGNSFQRWHELKKALEKKNLSGKNLQISAL